MFKKINTKNESLIDILNYHKQVYSKRSVNNILDNICINNKSGVMTLKSTNNEVYIISTFKNTFEDMNFLVNFNDLYSILRNCKGILDLSIKNNKLSVNNAHKLSILSSEDFPDAPELKEDIKSFELNSTILLDNLESVIYAAAKDNLKAVYNTINFEFEKDLYNLVVTDSRRLAFKQVVCSSVLKEGEDKFNFLIPLDAIKCLMPILKNKNDICKVNYSGNIVIFEVNNLKLYTKIIDDFFPNWKQVIPKQKDIIFSFTVDRLKFIDVLKSVIDFNPKSTSNKIEFLLTEENIKLFAKKEDEEFNSSISYINKSGKEEVNFGVNAKYVLDAIKIIKGKDIKIQGSMEMSPLVINDNHIVMPIKIHNRCDD